MSGIRNAGMRPKLSKRVRDQRKKFDESMEAQNNRERAKTQHTLQVKYRNHNFVTNDDGKRRCEHCGIRESMSEDVHCVAA